MHGLVRQGLTVPDYVICLSNELIILITHGCAADSQCFYMVFD